MKLIIKELADGEIREYDEKNIKGGSKRIVEAVKNFNELKKREDANSWALMIELVGMKWDMEFLEVPKYEIAFA